MALNITVVNTALSGYLSVYPASSSYQPSGSSALNWVQGKIVPNLVIVKLSASGAVDIYDGSGGTVDVVVDVAGWYSQ